MAPKFYRYDALTDSWLTCPPLLLARSAAAAAFFKGCVFVAGANRLPVVLLLFSRLHFVPKATNVD
jgi:hypothetical protein